MGAKTKTGNGNVNSLPEEIEPAVGLIDTGEVWEPADQKSEIPSDSTNAPLKSEIVQDVTESAVRNILSGVTGGANLLAGERVGASLTMTKSEIDTIAPPLTRIINRNNRLKQLAAQGDLAQVVFGITFGYGVRVVGEAAETQRIRAEMAEDDQQAQTTNGLQVIQND